MSPPVATAVAEAPAAYVRAEHRRDLTCTKLKHEFDCEAVNKDGKHVFLAFPFNSYNCSGLEAASDSALVCAYRAP